MTKVNKENKQFHIEGRLVHESSSHKRKYEIKTHLPPLINPARNYHFISASFPNFPQ